MTDVPVKTTRKHVTVRCDYCGQEHELEVTVSIYRDLPPLIEIRSLKESCDLYD